MAQAAAGTRWSTTMAGWTADNIPLLRGRSFLVTGPGGLGFETALALARADGEIILAGRDATKGAAACRALRLQVPAAAVHFELLDLAQLSSIRDFADRLKRRRSKIDVLINNAGVMAPPKRRTTADGFELQFGTNHLGHFALTGLLLPLLRRGRQPRVVSVSSLAHRTARIAFDDLQSERSYRPWARYGQSKLANLLFAFELQKRSAALGWGIASIAVHPGISRTDLIANSMGHDSLAQGLTERIGGLLLQSAAQGALPTLYAATAADARPGGYYGPDGFWGLRGWPMPALAADRAKDAADARRLWELSEQLSGVAYG